MPDMTKMELIIVAGPTAARAPPPSPIRARKPRLLYWEGPATPAPRIPRALAPRSPGDLFARVPSPATTHVTKPSPLLAFSRINNVASSFSLPMTTLQGVAAFGHIAPPVRGG